MLECGSGMDVIPVVVANRNFGIMVDDDSASHGILRGCSDLCGDDSGCDW